MVFLSSEVNDTDQRKRFKTQCTKGSWKREGHKTVARITAKTRAGMLFFLSQVTQRKAVRGQRGVLTITLAPCKGKPMSGMHTAIQVKSEEEQVPSAPFIWEGDISLFTRELTQEEHFVSIHCTHNETDKYQDARSLPKEARLHS